jgi:Zinc knuckle
MAQEFEEQPCFICGGTGHRQFECPNKADDVYKLPEHMQAKVDQLYQRDVARMQVRFLCVAAKKKTSYSACRCTRHC